AQTASFPCTAANKCSVTGTINLDTITVDPYAATRHFDAPPAGPYVLISSLTSSAKTATAKLASNQTLPFTSGSQVTVAAASPAGYDGSFSVAVTSSTTFTYTVGTSGLASATAVSPATSIYAYKTSSCVAFTSGANNPGGTAANPKCYLGGA